MVTILWRSGFTRSGAAQWESIAGVIGRCLVLQLTGKYISVEDESWTDNAGKLRARFSVKVLNGSNIDTIACESRESAQKVVGVAKPMDDISLSVNALGSWPKGQFQPNRATFSPVGK